MEHDLWSRCDSLFVDMPFSIGRWHLIFACCIVRKMTIEAADSPGLVAVGVGESRTSRRFTISTVPSHLAIPVADA